MYLYNESDVLNIDYRLKVIADILSEANKARKREAVKRHEVDKDQTVKWVIAKLKREGLKDETIALMENRAANISIGRKIIDKLSRCYSGGVTRETGNSELDQRISQLAELLNFDQTQKKVDRISNLQRNCLSMTLPERVYVQGEKEYYRLKKKVFAPFQYDVLEDAKDPECPAGIVLSDFVDRTIQQLPISGSPAVTQLENEVKMMQTASYNPDPDFFIFWTTNFHFTCDRKGNIIKTMSPENLQNPIGEIPGVTYDLDQDGCYWSSGGQDLTDGAILINTLLTDMFAIAYMQGWGQVVITGKGINKEKITVGPHNAMIFNYDPGKDEPEPKVTVVNANPPLDQWMAAIEQAVALLLSTNNLSPSSIAVKLDLNNFPSGIAMLVEKSEATNSIGDKQKKFQSNERKEWLIATRWMTYLMASDSLVPEFKEVGSFPQDPNVTVKFNDTKEVVTEAERLDNLKKRKELGLNTMLELIMMDNPGMNEEQAKAKLAELNNEKMDAQAKEMADAIKNGEQNSQEYQQGGEVEGAGV